ncbi:type III-B CRISPR module-associated Cmr3 family protein [Tistrella mobilis]
MAEPSALLFIFEPLDTLFFRTGRPFNQDDPGAALAESLFPPNPPTLVGALRAALARLLGWDGQNDWSTDIKVALGDGDRLAAGLRFQGPWLMRREPDGAWHRLYPAPASVVETPAGTPAGRRFRRLQPSATVLQTDLGPDPIRLPAPATDERDAAFCRRPNGLWLTADGLSAVLKGKVPGQAPPGASRCWYEEAELWAVEQRVGIGRDNATRRVEDGHFYIASHIRPVRGVALALQVSGLSAELRAKVEAHRGELGVVSLGGEHRAAWLSCVAPPRPVFQRTADTARRVAIALTPVRATAAMLEPQASFAGHDGLKITMVSALRADIAGGWDSVGNRPMAQHPLLAAGTTWHITCDRDLRDEDLPRSLGGMTDWGYGELIWGRDASSGVT